MRYFYNAQLIETTQDAKVVFYQSQFSCHNAKVVLADRGDNGQVLIGQSPRHRRTFPQSRFPSLEAFGRRPRRQLHRRDGPSSETLHNSGHQAGVVPASGPTRNRRSRTFRESGTLSSTKSASTTSGRNPTTSSRVSMTPADSEPASLCRFLRTAPRCAAIESRAAAARQRRDRESR